MKIIKPLYLNDKNFISYLLAPLTIFTILINIGKNFLIRKYIDIVRSFHLKIIKNKKRTKLFFISTRRIIMRGIS